MKEFPTKEWKKSTLNDFLKHVKTKAHDCSRALLMMQSKNGEDISVPCTYKRTAVLTFNATSDYQSTVS